MRTKKRILAPQQTNPYGAQNITFHIMIKNFQKSAIITDKGEVSYSQLFGYVDLYGQHTPSAHGKRTIIFAENREGWIYAFLSVWRNEGIPVPVDASSTVEDLAYILRDSTPDAVWASKKTLSTTQKAIEETAIDCKILIIDDYENAVVSEQKEWPGRDLFATSLQEIAVIIYTSGTTGSPKGVMLTYANLQANMNAVSIDVPIFTSERRTMILLPLHHVLPLLGSMVMPLVAGGGVAICPGMTGPEIMRTLERGKIAIVIGVPRLWQTLYGGIKKKIDASPLPRMLFSLCAKLQSGWVSRLIFSSVHKKLGGHLMYCVCGGAALDKEIGIGMKTLGLRVLEGYGMTECAPMISFTRPDDIIPGCAGKILPMAECTTIDGELCVRGANVMRGYWQRPEETAAVIDANGYLHTGDLGYIDNDNRIYITGRTKEIIVLSNGKNIQPAEIEYKLEAYDAFVKEAAVIQSGDMLRAIIVPNETWAQGKSDSDVEQLLKDNVLRPYNLSTENYKKIMSIFVYHGQLPRTRMEKLQRYKLAALCDSQDTPTAAPTTSDAPAMTEEARIIVDYIKAEKGVDVTPDMHLETDLAFDSLDMVGLQSFLDQSFGVDYQTDQLAAFDNIQTLADSITKHHTRLEVEHIDWHKTLTATTTHLQLPRGGLMHRFYAASLRLFFRLYNRLTVKGKENIPTQGPFILAANHQSYMDGALIVAGLSGHALDNIYFYATEEHVQGRFMKKLAHEHNVILMEHRNLKNSILKMAEVLKQGRSMAIFPEGSRTHTGRMTAFKKTFAILATELNVPILPVVIDGAFAALPRGTHFIKPKKITVRYLPLIHPQPGSSYDALSARVKESIDEYLS